ncbi:MAG: BtpA/SgcQ family protein [Phycisphaerales bacterium]|nr:BtpA/SgcQ family protein [Phycisphaerales bacterium]
MNATADIFGRERALLAMVHVDALPGTPRHDGRSVATIAHRAADEARMLVEAGFDGVIVENMHDAPYLLRDVGSEIATAMTAVTLRVKDAIGATPLGVQVLAGANMAALAVAHAAGAQFIRAEGFVFSSIADEGLMARADAGPLLRYRKQIGAEGVRILADIKKKHSSHAITADVDLGETAHAAAFFGADGLVITGIATGHATSLDDLRAARHATHLPIVVGSGATPETLGALFEHAHAVIVGSWYKRDGLWSNAPDPARVKQLVTAANAARA